MTPIKLIHAIADELRDIWHTRRERAHVILYTLDNLALALITLGRCQIGDTISSKAWQLEGRGRLQGRIARPVIDWLFARLLGETDHCAQAYRTFLRITGAPAP